MVQTGVKGRIVFIGSTLSLMSFVGYASYSPAKHALRGLADTLRSELLLYGIKVQVSAANFFFLLLLAVMNCQSLIYRLSYIDVLSKYHVDTWIRGGV